MRVLGIDPGTRFVGFGCVEQIGNRIKPVEFGVIRINTKQDFAFRLRDIFDEIGKVVERVKPDVCAIEEVFYGKNFKAAIKIGEGRAAAMLAIATRDYKVYEYAARLVKKAVVGNGNADKSQVQRMIKMLLGLPELPEQDAADALAIAICHCHRKYNHWLW